MSEPVTPPVRDSVRGLPGSPPIVSVSDIHGYLYEGESALLAVGEHPDYDPVVTADEEGLHWAGNDYVLVFNGDLIDRGPANEETVEMVQRLCDEAPPGRVRVTVGNHEMAIVVPEVVTWPEWYSGKIVATDRPEWLEGILAGHIVAAYEGYNYDYVHAGRPSTFEVAELNDRLFQATERLKEADGTLEDGEIQDGIAEEYPDLFGVDGPTGRGPNAGAFWMDFDHMPPDAPPQIVGHSRHTEPTRKGNVVCQNVIRDTRPGEGGEAALIETENELLALIRNADRGVRKESLDTE